uniref:Uncharacterized protein n=1 Tax=Panagrolaimus davidi TaxID=227884 RepID=A0A914QGE9_9BILA
MSSKFDVFELTKHYEDDEKRFVTLLDLLNELWTNTKEEYKKKITKTFVTQVIECYSHENSRFRSDPRLLRAWDLLVLPFYTLTFY